MKRQKTKAIWTVLVAVFFLFLPSCEREEDLTAGRIEVLSEKYGGSSAKLAVCDSVSTWSSGDRLRINGDVAEVEIIDGHAYIGDAVARDVNRALFPASLASGDLSSDEVTVTLPAAYHYRTDGSGRQVLDIPMAATSSGTNPLEFKHLTGLLCITIKNTRAESITLQSLTVTSNKYQLSGSRTIDFSSITTIAPIVAANEADRSATLAIGGAVTLNSNSTATFLIPVAPVGSDNSFTITVDANASLTHYIFTRSQGLSEGTDRSFSRNQLGYVYSGFGDMNVRYQSSLFEKIDGYYLIKTPQELMLFVDAVNNGYYVTIEQIPFYYSNSACKIMNNIDMTGYTINPINGFTGEIDGNGKVISNLTIEGCSVGTSYACALFHGAGGTNIIHDITLDNLSLVVPSSIDGSSLFIGAFCAEPSGDLTLSHCNAVISSVQIDGTFSNGIYFGGLVGRSESYSIKLVYDTVCLLSHIINSSGLLYYGGFIGRVNVSSTIKNSQCVTNAILSSRGAMYVGGYVGRCSGLSVGNCSVSGSISAATSSVTCKLGKYIGWLESGSLTPSNSSSSIAFTKNGSPYSAPNYE